jgi:hypothetical protein
MNKKRQPQRLPSLPFMHQPYCCQVALQQSLLPLQVDGWILRTLNEKTTNYFSVHCQT